MIAVPLPLPLAIPRPRNLLRLEPTAGSLGIPSYRASGQSSVEFAFVSALLFVFLLGIVEMGRLMFTYSVVSNAAQEGARYGITRPRDVISRSAATATAAAGGAVYLAQQVVPTGCDVIDLARSKIWGAKPQDVAVRVWYDGGDDVPIALSTSRTNPNYYPNVIRAGNRINVEATYHYDFMVPLIGVFAPDGLTIRMSAARTILSSGDTPQGSCSSDLVPAPAPVPPTAEPTRLPTWTPFPTDTPNVTNTPQPTNTPVPLDTYTPSPTATSGTPTSPSPTPSGTRTPAASTPTSTPRATNTPVPLQPTNTPPPTPTATPTPVRYLTVGQIDARKPNGNNKPLDIKVIVIDQAGYGVTGATVQAVINPSNGSSTSVGLSDMGAGVYQICGAGNYSGNGGGNITVAVYASKTIYLPANASDTATVGSLCP